MLLAYHSNPAIRKEYLQRVIDHRAADQISKGRYWEDGKGCAVGCTIHSGNHASYEKELGIPSELAYLEDFIFEDLPNARAMMWPEQFLAAIPVPGWRSPCVPDHSSRAMGGLFHSRQMTGNSSVRPH